MARGGSRREGWLRRRSAELGAPAGRPGAGSCWEREEEWVVTPRDFGLSLFPPARTAPRASGRAGQTSHQSMYLMAAYRGMDALRSSYDNRTVVSDPGRTPRRCAAESEMRPAHRIALPVGAGRPAAASSSEEAWALVCWRSA